MSLPYRAYGCDPQQPPYPSVLDTAPRADTELIALAIQAILSEGSPKALYDRWDLHRAAERCAKGRTMTPRQLSVVKRILGDDTVKRVIARHLSHTPEVLRTLPKKPPGRSPQ